MPTKVNKDDDTTSGEEDIENAGAWAQGLSKGVFAHKRSSGNKRKLKSPRKQSRKKRKKPGAQHVHSILVLETKGTVGFQLNC